MTITQAWGAVVLAGMLEIGFAVGLKASAGLSHPLPALASLAALLGSLGFLAGASRQLPIGIAYAVWTSIGAAGTAIAGFLIFGEPAGWPRIACIGLILTGVAGLKVLEP